MKTLEETINELESMHTNIKIMQLVLDTIEKNITEILNELNSYAIKE